MEVLCRRYWPPIYAFIRRRGYSQEDAQDLTQEFFARLIGKDYLQAADAAKGRFRTLLLTAVSRFLVNERERAQAQKRGGSTIHLSIEQCLEQEEFWNEPVEADTPERLYHRCWAQTLLKSVLSRLRGEMESTGAGEKFEALKVFLSGETNVPAGGELAARFQVSEATVYSWVHRLRHRYGELLREEVAQTVNSPEEVQDELNHLLNALSF